jgi:hypothetical protein
MSTLCTAGYIGIYREPYSDLRCYGDSIYAITDENQQELILILLTPGCYKEAFALASHMSFQRIKLIVPSMDVLFISDVFRLVTDLMKIKKSVKWYYPEHIATTPANVLFEMAQMTNNYLASDIGGTTIEFKLSSSRDENHRFYDIYVCRDDSYIVFCMYMDAEKLTKLMTSTDHYDQIHMPYNCTFYGGLTGRECGALNSQWTGRIVPNNYGCTEEYAEAANTGFCIPTRAML